MAVFKCKICGGNLDIADGSSIAVCDYCGTKQTVPTTKDDVVANLFNRANNLRLKCEFDKAEQVYEKILDIDNTDAEAHWGMVLCKYGIEYVEDKKADSKIPTCHRTLYEAILTDVDYLATIENADVVQKELYEAEALVIDGLQKNILSIVNNEEPFDVFICYKETDDAGKRTIDSSIANDIYYQLTGEGFKVFYAPITLENKLGYEYEPYIFAALNSAKVMLVVGTKPEHFDAVWVRNEWSRYLKIMKTDRSKLIIPCYKDMDAYELPDEFAHLQAQDMGKIGFIQDLLRGINKLVTSSKPQSTIVKETVVHNADTNITPLLKRVFIFLEDEEWDNAEEYCEKVLDINPECAEAYIGKLMVELKVRTRNCLKNCKEIFESNSNYQKAMRFGDEEIKSELRDAISTIKKRNEEERLHQAYTTATMQMGSATTEKDFRSVASMFYNIQNYKDSSQKANECLARIEELKRKAEEERIRDARRLEEEKLEQERQNELKRIAKEKSRKRNKKLAIIIAPIVTLVVAFMIVLNLVIIPNSKYNAAVALMNEGKYTEAISAFELLDGYKDSENKIKVCNDTILSIKYSVAIELLNANEFQKATEAFEALNGYKDSGNKALECNEKMLLQMYDNAIFLMNNSKYEEAIYELELLDGYKDSKAKIKECQNQITENTYNKAITLMNEGKSRDAVLLFAKLGDYKDAREMLIKYFRQSEGVLSNGSYHTVGLKSDGTAVAVGANYFGRCDVSSWRNIVSVSAGSVFTIGLKSDGRVFAIGNNGGGQCNVSQWKNIVQVSAGGFHTVGLKSDGTVVAVGYNHSGQCDVSAWRDIVAVSACNDHTIGLKSNGTVIATGDNSFSKNVSEWENIIFVSVGGSFVVGLKSDGTVVAENAWGVEQSWFKDVSLWNDIVAISAGNDYTIGLKSDGTVVAVGDNSNGQCDVSEWEDIIAISAGDTHTIGLKSDGTVVATGDNEFGQCDVSKWNLIN